MEKHFNFMGDTQDYKFHPRLSNPYGLRGNPDTQANSYDQGDGLNGTPEYGNFMGTFNEDEVWSNHPGFIGSWFGNNKDENTATGPLTENQTLSDGQADVNQNGIPDYLDVNTAEPADTPNWWQRTFGNRTEEQKQKAAANWAAALTGLNQGFKTGIGAMGTPGTTPGIQSPVLQEGGTTTTTTNAGLGGGNSKVIGYVLLGALVVGGVIYAMSLSNKPMSSPRPMGNNYNS
jgi:hypothetical protein